MTKLILTFAALIVAAAGLFGQTPTPTPKQQDDSDVVKISTNLIQVDVTVTDGKGKIVTDLKPEDFEIYENGHKQKITNFSFVSSVRETTEKPAAVDKAAIPLPPSQLRPEKIRRTVALVVDDLSLSFESAYQARRALKKFVDEQMQDGDLIAIIRTGAGIGALQQFTSDKRILYAAIDKVKWNPLGSGGISAFAPIESSPDTSLQATTDPTPTPDNTPASTGAGQSLEDFRSSVFATGTLGALKYIVTGMSQLPGRKSVILFSDGFKMFEQDESGFKEEGRVLEFLRQLVDTANRSSVVFYTVDARGLQTLGFTAADAISDTSPDAMNKAAQSRRDQLLDTQEGLSFLAEETGGFAVKNSNDLSGGVRRVLDDQSYYLLAYEPDSDTFDPAKRKYNKLEVKVLRKGTSARYRSGFFNVADKDTAKTPPETTPVAQLENALVSPFAVSGINLRLNALFGSDAANGPFVRSLLHIDASDLKFTDQTDGTKKAILEVLAMSFGDNGEPVDRIAKTYTLTLKADSFQRLIADGFIYQFVFPVKTSGAYQYRVAIRDAQGGKVGSASQFIEVPNLKKNRLALSSIVLESLTTAEWERMMASDVAVVARNPIGDTALRRIKIGTVLRYGVEIYNARLGSDKRPSLQTKVRIFRDGSLVLDGKPAQFDLLGQTDMQHLKMAGALSIGDKLQAGDYVLQVIVTDPLAKAKQQIATQFIQFEVVQ